MIVHGRPRSHSSPLVIFANAASVGIMSKDLDPAQIALGARIKAARERAAVGQQILTDALSLPDNAISLIEAGKRRVSSFELSTIARLLGVSALTLLDADSPLVGVSIAARALQDTSASDETAIARLQALAELSQVLTDGGLPAAPAARLAQAPVVNMNNWRTDGPRLAAWAREVLEPRCAPTEALMDELAEAVEDCLGVDVLMEPHAGKMLGGTASMAGWHCIYVNTARPRRQQLFTFAHELGHLLAGDTTPLRVETTLARHSPAERFANAFAADFLMPENSVRNIVGQQLDLQNALQAFHRFGVSIDALSWRLHSLGYLSDAQRPLFAKQPAHTWAVDLDLTDPLRDAILRTQISATHAIRSPRLMTQRAFDGWQAGAVSVRPYAALTEQDPEQLLADNATPTVFAF